MNYLGNALTGGAFGEPLWFTSVWPNRLIVTLNIIWFMLPFAMLMILAGLQVGTGGGWSAQHRCFSATDT